MDQEAGAGSNSGFQPKEEIINTLLSLGFSRNAAVKGCYYTGNYSADLAAAWVIENQDKNLDGPLEVTLTSEGQNLTVIFSGDGRPPGVCLAVLQGQADTWVEPSTNDDLEFEDEEDSEGEMPEGFDLHKMVFVVNMELNMGVGKVGAQCAHAALALHRIMIDNTDKFGGMLMSWEQFGETKIVLKGDNSAQLVELAQKAESLGLPSYIVHDAGRTQIAAGSQTVLGIIGKIDTVDSITGKLKLL